MPTTPRAPNQKLGSKPKVEAQVQHGGVGMGAGAGGVAPSQMMPGGGMQQQQQRHMGVGMGNGTEGGMAHAPPSKMQNGANIAVQKKSKRASEETEKLRGRGKKRKGEPGRVGEGSCSSEVNTENT